MAPPARELQQAEVAFFFNQRNLIWNQQRLVQFGGRQFAEAIRIEQANTILRPGFKDKLMFTWAKNGEFSVKATYHLLRNSQPLTRRHVPEQESRIWKKIWKVPYVPPKIRMFFWKAMQGALPTAAALSKRIPSIEPDCKLCGMTTEDVLHTLFLCQHARATWFSSPLCLRSSEIQVATFQELLLKLWSPLDAEQIALFMTLAWCIWKARWKEIFQQIKCSPMESIKAAFRFRLYQDMGAILHPQRFPANKHVAAPEQQLERGSVAYVDGSFDGNGKGGAAFILHHNHVLLRYEMKDYNDGVSPFHMETCALLMALRVAVDFRLMECVFLTNSELLVQTLEKSRNFQPLQATDWRSYNQS